MSDDIKKVVDAVASASLGLIPIFEDMAKHLKTISAHPDFIEWQKVYHRNKRRNRPQERKFHK